MAIIHHLDLGADDNCNVVTEGRILGWTKHFINNWMSSDLVIDSFVSLLRSMREKTPGNLCAKETDEERRKLILEKVLDHKLLHIYFGNTANVWGKHFRRTGRHSVVLNKHIYNAIESNAEDSPIMVFAYYVTLLHELAHIMGTMLVRKRYFTPIQIGGKITEEQPPLEKPAILEVEDDHDGAAEEYHIGEAGEYIERLIFGGKPSFVLEKKEQFPDARTVYIQTTEATNFGQLLDPIELGFVMQADPSQIFPCVPRRSKTFYFEGHVCRSHQRAVTVLEQDLAKKTVQTETFRCARPGSNPVNADAIPLLPSTATGLGRRRTIGAFFSHQKAKLSWKNPAEEAKPSHPLKRNQSVNALARRSTLQGGPSSSTPLLEKF